MPHKFMKRSRRKDLDTVLPTRTEISDWLYYISNKIRKAKHHREPAEVITRLQTMREEYLTIKAVL